MPLKKCDNSGWKWGDSGHCYTGPDAKKNAIKQGLAIEKPAKFKKIMEHNKAAFIDWEGFRLAQAVYREALPRGDADLFLRSIASRYPATADTGKIPVNEDFDTSETNDGEYGSSHPIVNTERTTEGSDEEVQLENQTTADLDSPVNEQFGNVATPPYNKDASPETDPEEEDKPDYKPATREEMTAGHESNEAKPTNLKDTDAFTFRHGSPPGADASSYLDEVAERENWGSEQTAGEEAGENEDEWGNSAMSSLEEYIAVAFISTDTRNSLPDDDFAGPNRSFPVRNQEDVKHAAMLLHHSHDPSAVKKNIVRIARRKNLKLPATWSHSD